MRFVLVAILLGTLPLSVASAESINGQYLEARNSNMWAGPCVFNAEIRLTGEMAVMAWKVGDGTYDDVSLNGLKVVAVVLGDQTFGIGEEVRTKTVFIVDQLANKAQREALIKMAKDLAGETIQEVVAVKPSKIKMNIDDSSAPGFSVLDAGIAQVRTRPVQKADHTCGNERMAYPMLAKASDEHAAYTMQNEYSGKDLQVKVLKSNNILSGVLAKFSL